MLTMGSARPPEHPNQTQEEAPPGMEWLDTQPMELEMEITFGTAFTDLCIWIWNLRISYPDEDIFLAFLDIFSSCFCFPRIFPDLVGALGFIVGPIFYAANAGVFGSVASASSWEPFRVAIVALAVAFFFFPDLVATHDWLLQKLRWSDASSPLGSTTTIVHARPCTRHKCVFDSVDRRIPTKHNIYIDDNHLAKVKAYMHQALASGFKATFTIMGHPCPSARPVPVNLDKLEELVVSPLQILLGLLVNTREMTVSISDEFCREILALLTATWHCPRESFTVKELKLLVASLSPPFISSCHNSPCPLPLRYTRIKPSSSTLQSTSVHSSKRRSKMGSIMSPPMKERSTLLLAKAQRKYTAAPQNTGFRLRFERNKHV